ncbi:MAG TPA: M1 family metallopeptidase [Longimicrobiales bacterium]|nr:M1 family metallopeptidase [Longimicrobiales bacterium]
MSQRSILGRAPVALVFLLLGGCAEQAVRTSAGPAPAIPDVHSFARPQEARVRHVSLDLTPDFATRRLAGTARLVIERATGADSIILDVQGLTIEAVTDARGASLEHGTGAADPVLGTPLVIRLSESDTLVVRYRTAPEAEAVQWLEPAQTAGGRLPFLFTQGQAILTRTWVPTQDSPGIRQTYDATIHVPSGMRAVMSAELLTPEGEPGPEGRTTFRFRMAEPIPPYLFALAVGDLAFREIGPRTGVWAEPSVVSNAASEFVEVDDMIDAAERLYGPYRWGRYDILVLPPSFPFGGMENPRLTFATPTILAGDRSLVSLIAHELAHSWSGNLVTNAVWDDFWLNEGFTTYIESRIMEELRGREYADMLRQLGRQDLEDAIREAGGPGAPDTRLRLDLAGRNPDDGMTDVAYEKGSAFLQTIEAAVGRDRLDGFLRDYFDRFAFQPMTSELFLEHLNTALFRGDEALAAQVRAQEWVFQPGLPDNAPRVSAAAFDSVDRQLAALTSGTAPAQLETQDWTTHEWLHFLRALPDTLSRDQLAALDTAFRFTASGNSEILFEWLRIAIRHRYEPAFPALERFLTSQGRRKFLAPLYTDLAATSWGRPMALAIYARARPTYHAVSANTIDAILEPAP